MNPARVPVTTSITKPVYDYYYHLAQDEGVSVSEIMRRVLEKVAKEDGYDLDA